MTKDDILRMGREAGMHDPMVFIGAYERFAKLVAAFAAEREREECAKLCEDEAWRLKKLAVDTGSRSTNTKAIQASNDADAIRARGNA